MYAVSEYAVPAWSRGEKERVPSTNNPKRTVEYAGPVVCRGQEGREQESKAKTTQTGEVYVRVGQIQRAAGIDVASAPAVFRAARRRVVRVTRRCAKRLGWAPLECRSREETLQREQCT